MLLKPFIRSESFFNERNFVVVVAVVVVVVVAVIVDGVDVVLILDPCPTNSKISYKIQILIKGLSINYATEFWTMLP